jgi:alkylhydroperoxidase/carboxymuconolactone decarboxylase family protein YurZ
MEVMMPKKEQPRKTPRAPRTFLSFAKKYPEIAQAYDAMGQAVRDAGPLTDREIALAKLALSIGAKLEGATHAHCRRALALGIEPNALRQVAVLSSPTVGFPSMMAAYKWVDEIVRRRSRKRRSPSLS